MNKIMQTQKKIEKAVVGGYQAIENGVVSGYKKVEDAFVSGYKKIEDSFTDTFMTPDAESTNANSKHNNNDEAEE